MDQDPSSQNVHSFNNQPEATHMPTDHPHSSHQNPGSINRKSIAVGVGLGILQTLAAAIFIPHTLDQRLSYILNPNQLVIRYLVVIVGFVVVAGLIIKYLVKLPHPFRNAFYVPLLAQSIAVIAGYKTSYFLILTGIAFVVSQLIWGYVARANKTTQNLFVLLVAILVVYSISLIQNSI